VLYFPFSEATPDQQTDLQQSIVVIVTIGEEINAQWLNDRVETTPYLVALITLRALPNGFPNTVQQTQAIPARWQWRPIWQGLKVIKCGDDVRFIDHQFLWFTSAEHGVFRLLSVIEASALNA
jgi:hypothetical protein